MNGTVSELDKSPTSVHDELNSTATTGQSSISNLDTTVDLQEVTLNSTVTEHTPKKKSKKRGDGSGTPKATKPKPKTFVKDEIVIECYITRNVKGKTKTGEDTWRTNTLVFKLDETPHRTKESFDELEDTINVRVCVTGSSSKNRKTTVLSVDDGSGVITTILELEIFEKIFLEQKVDSSSLFFKNSKGRGNKGFVRIFL